MARQKPKIEEFDRLSITDLMGKPTKELIIAIFIKTKQQNSNLEIHSDKLKWHDRFILGVISIMGLGIVASLIIGAINYYYF